MLAVIRTGGKQYIVKEGDIILVEKIPEEAGKKVDLETLLVGDEKEVKIGTPIVEGAKVEGEILTQKKAKKIRVFKMKSKKKYRRTRGHRQQLTEVKIVKIKAK
jgi:large subunit ribosomal protein L21